MNQKKLKEARDIIKLVYIYQTVYISLIVFTLTFIYLQIHILYIWMLVILIILLNLLKLEHINRYLKDEKE